MHEYTSGKDACYFSALGYTNTVNMHLHYIAGVCEEEQKDKVREEQRLSISACIN